ncbi:MAG: lysophospholipid acyltransferase family protein [Candidatus Omnitrophota bacterium]
MLYAFGKFLCGLLLKVFFRFKVYGLENVPPKGGFILASNHTSYLDPVALGVASPRALNFMARHDLFFNPFFSRLISGLGAFAVRPKAADPDALKEAIRRLRQGAALVVFPEGRRVPKGQEAAPGAGVGFLAQKLSVPVIPALIKGADTALPIGAGFIRPARISVRFGKQILVERRTPYEDAARHIMSQIRQLS